MAVNVYDGCFLTSPSLGRKAEQGRTIDSTYGQRKTAAYIGIVPPDLTFLNKVNNTFEGIETEPLQYGLIENIGFIPDALAQGTRNASGYIGKDTINENEIYGYRKTTQVNGITEAIYVAGNKTKYGNFISGSIGTKVPKEEFSGEYHREDTFGSRNTSTYTGFYDEKSITGKRLIKGYIASPVIGVKGHLSYHGIITGDGDIYGTINRQISFGFIENTPGYGLKQKQGIIVKLTNGEKLDIDIHGILSSFKVGNRINTKRNGINLSSDIYETRLPQIRTGSKYKSDRYGVNFLTGIVEEIISGEIYKPLNYGTFIYDIYGRKFDWHVDGRKSISWPRDEPLEYIYKLTNPEEVDVE
jgi:hypothetical protein